MPDFDSEENQKKVRDIIVPSGDKLCNHLLDYYGKTLKPFGIWVEDASYEFIFSHLHPIIFPRYCLRVLTTPPHSSLLPPLLLLAFSEVVPLLLLFQHKAEDGELVKKAELFQHIGPAHLGIRKRFWLTELEADGTQISPEPYSEAISSIEPIKYH